MSNNHPQNKPKHYAKQALTCLLPLLGVISTSDGAVSLEFTCDTAHQAFDPAGSLIATGASTYLTPFTFNLKQGEQLNFNGSFTDFSGNSNNVMPFYALASAPLVQTPFPWVNVPANSVAPFSNSFTATQDGAYIIGYNGVDMAIATFFSCNGGNLANEVNSTSQQINSVLMNKTNQLISGRVRSLKRSKTAGTKSTLPQNGIPNQDNDNNGQNTRGQNAGAPDYRHGFWTNLSLSYSKDSHVSQDIGGVQGSFVAGLDSLVTDDLMIGAAINLEYAYQSRDRNQFQYSSTGLGISPYISYQIDEIFSLSSMANVTYSSAHAAGSNNVQLDQNSLRWNVAVQGDGFWNWGNWGLLSGVSLSYGQTSSRSTKDSTGAYVSGSLSRLGTAAITLQPSYYWQYDDNLGLEPYLLTEYSYDYSMTKLSTSAAQSAHPNDPDAFRLGIGLNLFGSNFYSGNVEASTVLGRDDYTEANITGNIRVRF